MEGMETALANLISQMSWDQLCHFNDRVQKLLACSGIPVGPSLVLSGPFNMYIEFAKEALSRPKFN